MERLIIDTDPGVDDAHAIMLALAHPGATVEAITVVAGNVGLERTVANACAILDVMEADVPVYAGCATPLLPAGEDAAHVHGADGLGDSNLPSSQRRVEPEHAAVALVQHANAAPGELTLVTIGPLTNVAVALKLDPDLPRKFKRLVVMGGAITAKGNTTNLTAEFNVYADPEAAYMVFEAWPEFTLASWETVMVHGIEGEPLERWMQLDTPRARFFQRINANLMEFVVKYLGRRLFLGADTLAMVAALEPDIVTRAETHNLTVELNGTHTRGQTVVDWRDASGRPANAHIMLEIDRARHIELVELPLR